MVFNSNITLITSDTTLSTSNNLYLVDASNISPPTFTITLPDVNSDGINFKIIRIDNDTNSTVTIEGFSGAQTINGLTSIKLQPNMVQYVESFGIDDATGGVWYTSSRSFNSGSSLPLSFRFNRPNGNPTTTNSTTYSEVGSFVYRGTNVDNMMNLILAVVNTSNTSATGRLRIFDQTNVVTIAESATFGPTNGSLIVIDMGAISNLPSDEARMLIQIRRVNTTHGGNAGISTLQLYGDTI